MDAAQERLIRLFGTAKPSAPYRILQAGKLTARFEGGNLRYVKFDGHEILRSIGYIIRDEDWGTYEPALKDLHIDETSERFEITYKGSCRSPQAELRYDARIVGKADGSLDFSVTAKPDGDFKTNRCGFTVLHPIEGVAGTAVTVEHISGAIEKATFPELINPWQPFKEIRALTHVVAGRYKASCRTEGAPFEMEDHRNWSDASYKTYVRPLEWPWPYTMKSGEPDRQAVSLAIQPVGDTSANVKTDPVESGPVTIDLSDKPSGHTHPQIGLAITPEEVDETISGLERLKSVSPQVVLCHYDSTVGHWHDAFASFARLQNHFPARYILECVVAAHGDLTAELDGVASGVKNANLDLSAIAVCPSVDRQSTPPGSKWPPCPPLEDIYAVARSAFPGIKLGGGMFSYFTELNRKRPPVELLDFITHATNPIVHAADDESVMETLEALPHITRSARAIIGETKPYHIGPSTIGMRQNPYGSRTFANPENERICMADTDPRHFGLFGAAWTIGYAARIAQGGPALHVPAACVGPRGIIAPHKPGGTPSPCIPLFHAVRWLTEIADSTSLICQSSAPYSVLGLTAKTAKGKVALLANLTAKPLKIVLSGAALPSFSTVEILDADCYDNAADDGLTPRRESWSTALELDAYASVILRE